MKFRKAYKKDPGLWHSLLIILIVIFLASMSPSDASGADKKVTEGYQGSERIKLTEKPVRAKSGVTLERGYIGTKYYRVRRTRHSNGTQTALGWHGPKRIKITEKSYDGS